MDQAIRVEASLKGLLYISQVKFKSYSTEQNVSHGFNVFVTIVRVPNSNVTTRVIIVIWSCATKTNSWITLIAGIQILVRNDPNPCFSLYTITIEALHVAVKLQGSLRAYQRLPCVPTQWGIAVFSISKQWVQRFSLSVNDNKVELLVNLHTKTDLGERCIPVCR